MKYAFTNSGSMNSLHSYYEGAYAVFPDITVLGNFVNNHDNPRFLHNNENTQTFKAALAFTLASVGIPMVYYGDEQAYKGGQDPANRETLWDNMREETDIYNFLKVINQFRKESQFYNLEQVERYADDSFYGFTRGDTFFAFTNSMEPQTRTIQYHPYADGTKLCNVFNKEDCIEVVNRELPIMLLNGEVKIYTPSKVEEKKSEGGLFNWEQIKLSIATATPLC